jgi:hypothetical protein
MHYPAQVDSLLADAGLRVGRRSTVGFGPFTVRSRKLLGDESGRRLDRRLSGLAADRLPFLRRRGWHYVVLATAPER